MFNLLKKLNSFNEKYTLKEKECNIIFNEYEKNLEFLNLYFT